MTDADIAELARLLRQLSEAGLGVPRAPREVFLALRGVVCQPTVEILLPDEAGEGAWLTHRKDRHWDGWHLPGGFVGAGESVEAAVARVGRLELGADVTLEAVVGHHAWTDHPYATPLSLLCRCRSAAAPQAGRHFTAPPDPMVHEHRVMLHRFHGWPEPDARSGA